MRQAGIIASAGLYALDNQFDRLVDDHNNAQILAHDAKLNATTLVQKLESEKGVLVGAYADGNRVRAVTNLHISSKDIEYTISSIRALLC
ncbi:l-allo-threonine aldolase [Plasmopara halstedii]|uniref:L-allo-threonine aldolase n=1 Tax=Plasmopara halstedii TaxID=4781 RepID=A0A0P1AFH4_PLAHL|nr:l-allo-threonine aldolase [Plasmopara halstedii]CEG39855.1 l-allo-threonine aldolase [Plasmopara halstedii]|eukprot:XP_024576224.1 l-allo-threonine aldolase [Plasmopara halstedii]